ncbi:MAG: helix-turn-helix domain-containing protein [Tabrizicola sp.]|nr:helix-turn-helix domain-containing protein [Tabrizicola sp.]
MATVHRGFRYKLAPTPEHEALFRQFAGVVRLVYNLALEQRRDWWRHYRRETGSGLINILRRNTASMLVEEGRWPPDEARTISGVLSPGGNPPALVGGGC